MNPAGLIPSPDPIPVAWGWFHVLLLFTFVVHLLVMNTMLGSGIIALLSHLLGRSESRSDSEDISRTLPYAIAFTVNTGVAPLLFLQVLYGHLFYASSILMAVYWISIVGILILAYYSAYLYDFKYDTLAGGRVFLIGLSVLIFLSIAFLFSNNLTLMLEPSRWEIYFERPEGTFLNLMEPTLLPRYLHFVVASVAVGGLFLAWMGRLKKTGESRTGLAQTERGLTWFSNATLIQLLVGFWFLLSLPDEVMTRFMGERLPDTLLFMAALTGVVLSLFFGFNRRLVPATLSLFGTVVLMALVRDLVRQGYLDPFFHVSSLRVVPQYSPLAVFLGCLVLGLFVVVWVLRLAAKAGKEGER